jgi:hypothetical protein
MDEPPPEPPEPSDIPDAESITHSPNVEALVPGSLDWRIVLATWAHGFFSLIHDQEVAELISQPQDAGTAGAWPLAYFTLYLQKRGFPAGEMAEVVRILLAMERAGLLFRCGWRHDMTGWPMQGQLYIAQGLRTPQKKGSMWLSEVIGPELIIHAYDAVTVQISGGEGRPPGTGLIVDHSHIVTNRHVVEAFVGHGIDGADIEIHPSFKPPGAEWIKRPSRVNAHIEVDVAVITGDFGENEGFPMVPGMVFRDPRPHDEVRVFGYPRAAGTTEQVITHEHGYVVTPVAESPAMDGYPRQKIFLTSAIERPGNSPIVASDGRVVGLVVDHTTSGLARTGPDGAGTSDIPPFYRGIPASEVVRAVKSMGFQDLLLEENPVVTEIETP